MTLAGVRPLLDVRGLTKSFGAVEACRSVDLALQAGQIHALIGPNGAGKTTIVTQIAGITVPDGGTILIDGTDISRTGSAERARLGIARSYQVSSLLERETAQTHVELAIRGRTGNAPMWFDMDGPAIAMRARDHLASCGLSDLFDTPVCELAHGQRRQVELAMVTAADPRVLLLDEPMAGLGHSETQAIVPLVEEMAHGRAVLLVEHDMDVVFALAHRITVMVAGAVLASGLPDDIRADPKVRAAYLTEDP